jgi:hypothetical protein
LGAGYRIAPAEAATVWLAPKVRFSARQAEAPWNRYGPTATTR